jgi:carnitine-CoA ligase
MSASSIADPLTRRAEMDPDSVVLVNAGRRWTAADLLTESTRIAGGLLELGVKGGDRVALLLDNGCEFVASIYALALIGAVQVPVNTAYRGAWLQRLLDSSAPSAIIFDYQYLGQILMGSASNRAIVAVGKEAGHQQEGGVVPWSDLSGSVPLRQADAREPCAIIYTSGTTGRSKGAVLAHRYYLVEAAAFICRAGMSREDVYVTCTPMFHGMAQLSGLMAPMLAGARTVALSRFSASGFWRSCAEEGATAFGAVGSMAQMLLNQPASSGDRRHSVRWALAVGVSRQSWNEFNARFGVTLLNAFGLTETGLLSCSSPEDSASGSAGTPLPHYEVAIHDSSGEQVPSGTVGEIVCRPRVAGKIMLGYHGMPSETLERMRDLWFHTGDAGFIDASGEIHFVDRMKDAIRRRGENISSFEVEETLGCHPAIADIAAYPVPSDIGEDEVMIAVVLAEGVTLDVSSFTRFSQEQLPRFAAPRYLRVVDELPRTPTLKVQKHALRERGTTGAIDLKESNGAVRGE